MNTLKLAAFAVMLVCGTALADDVEKKAELRIVIAGDGAGDAREYHWAGNQLDFDLDKLAIGESRTIDGEDGKQATVTRTEEGMQFSFDGQTVMMPPVGAQRMHMAAPGDPGHDAEFDVEIIGHGPHMMRAHHPKGVTIISGKPLDDSVKESIRSVLISAGHQDEVTFIDGSVEGKPGRMIRKRVEIEK